MEDDDTFFLMLRLRRKYFMLRVIFNGPTLDNSSGLEVVILDSLTTDGQKVLRLI